MMDLEKNRKGETRKRNIFGLSGSSTFRGLTVSLRGIEVLEQLF
jgi:hypothetical protein